VPGKRILVIDDERDIHRVLKALLEGAGYTVSSALDAAQGPMMARQVKPDLVILDVNMPGGGGPKVYERLRMMSAFTTVPVLVYTAVDRGEVESQIPERTDTMILAKPALPQDILSAVQKLLGPA